VGTGQDVTIRELAETIQKVVGFAGNLEFDTTKPDGTLRKLLDVSKLSAEGWQAKVPLEQGITQLYDWYQKNLA
jgi:GDP-L-fucose synthase